MMKFTNRLINKFSGRYVSSVDTTRKVNKKVLVVDTGIFLPIAIRFGIDGWDTHYYVDITEPYPLFTNYIIGDGFKNITKEKSLNIKDYDLIIFPDVGQGTLVEQLRKEGNNVFGAGELEKLELNRKYAKEVMDEIGVKHPESFFVKGKSGLLNFFKQNKGEYYIKINEFRGSVETFRVTNAEEIELMLNDLGVKFGPYVNEIDFIIEKKEEGDELGTDIFYDGEKFLKPVGFNVEQKGNNLYKIVEDSIWENTLEKFSPVLKKGNYRGIFCLESLYDGKDLYVLDITTRFCSPAFTLYSRYMKNFSEVVDSVARGKGISPEFDSKYYCEVRILSTESEDKWLVIDTQNIPFEVRKAVLYKDKIYVVPGERIVGTVFGEGDSYNKALDQAKQNTEKLDVLGKEFDSGIFDKFEKEYLKPLKEKYGIEF